MTFEPTTVGIGSIIVAIVVGVVAFLIRTFVDKPRNDVLRQDVSDLKASRDDARKERETLLKEHEIVKVRLAAAEELVTNRAKVDELFAYIQKLVIEGQPRQEKLLGQITLLSESVRDTVQQTRTMHEQNLDRYDEHNREALERHTQQMDVMRSMTALLEKIAKAFDIKLNGGSR